MKKNVQVSGPMLRRAQLGPLGPARACSGTTAKTYWRMKPSTKTGIADAPAVTIVVSRSAIEYRRMADSSPTLMPTMISMMIAQIASRRLLTARSPRISLTLRPVWNDSPRSHVDRALPVVGELHVERVVEAVALVDLLDLDRVGDPIGAAGDQVGRVAREREEEEEQERDREEDRRDDQQEHGG